jgi:tetratricopeptide (TPR) repeat protein
VYIKRRNFCGRKWLFDEIEAWRTSRTERALLITGDPGVGKSAIVAQLVHLNPESQVLAYHCCQAETRATLEPSLFVRNLAAMIASKLDDYAATLSDPAVEEALTLESCAKDPGSAFERGVLTPLESIPAPESGVRYILVDALDESLSLSERGPTIVDILAPRMERLPGWLRLVATTRNNPLVLGQLSGLRAREIDAHDRRNLDDVREFIKRRLSCDPLAASVRATSFSHAHVGQRLLEKSEGNFLYIQQVLEGVERDRYSLDELDALPPGLSGLYLRFFRRHFPDETTYASVRRILEVVVAAEEPISAEFLGAATELDLEAQLFPLLRQVSAFLPEREDSQGRASVSIYHKSLADWLTDPSQRGALHYITLRRGHERLAQVGWEEYRSEGRLSRYFLDHLPAHLMEVRQWGRLLDIVTDPRLAFIQRWIDEGKGDKGSACLLGLIRFLEDRNGNREVAAGLATQLARIHGLWGEYETAERWLNYALRRTSWRRGRRVRAVAFHELASLRLYSARFRDARRCYARALLLCRCGMPVHWDEAAANLIGLSTVAYSRYRFQRAYRFARRAMKAARHAGDVRHEIAGHRLTAAAGKILGRYEEAEAHILTALDLSKISEERIEWVRLLLLHGHLRYDVAILEEQPPKAARPLFQDALEEAQRLADLYSTLEAKIGLGLCSLAVGASREAIGWYEEVRDTLPTDMHPDLHAEVAVGFAAAAHQEGEMELAASLYEKILSANERYVHRSSTCKALVGLGAIQWHSSRRLDAQITWKKATRVAHSVAPNRRRLAEAAIRLCRTGRLVTPR